MAAPELAGNKVFERDLFVGLVAVVTGVILLVGGATGYDRMMQATLPQLLVYRFGMVAARGLVVFAGILFIVLGLFLMRGGTKSGSRDGQVLTSVWYGRPVLAGVGWSRSDEPEC